MEKIRNWANGIAGKIGAALTVTAVAMFGFVSNAFAQEDPDMVESAVSAAQTKGLNYIGLVLTMVAALAAAGIAIKIVPKVYNAISKRISG